MAQFSRWFFPATGNATSSFYCKYNDHTLQAYSAIMHFTGALASIPASYFTQHWGRKGSMIIAGTAFCIGAVFQASAKSTIALLFIGRVFWGIGESATCLYMCMSAAAAAGAAYLLLLCVCCCSCC